MCVWSFRLLCGRSSDLWVSRARSGSRPAPWPAPFLCPWMVMIQSWVTPSLMAQGLLLLPAFCGAILPGPGWKGQGGRSYTCSFLGVMLVQTLGYLILGPKPDIQACRRIWLIWVTFSEVLVHIGQPQARDIMAEGSGGHKAAQGKSISESYTLPGIHFQVSWQHSCEHHWVNPLRSSQLSGVSQCRQLGNTGTSSKCWKAYLEKKIGFLWKQFYLTDLQ